VSLQPSSPPAVPLAVMFGKSTVDVRNYTVQLVDSNGLVVARAEARLRSAITGTCGNDVQVYPAMPMFSTSVGRAYFLDGDTDVRYLAPDGSTGLAVRFAGSWPQVAVLQHVAVGTTRQGASCVRTT